MRSPARIARCLVAAFVLVLAATSATAKVANRDTASPTHGPGSRAFEAFVVDELPVLVVGKEFDWHGHHYRITRVHQITRNATQQTRRTYRNADVAREGWMQAILNLEIDGRLTKVRVEGNARYVDTDEGWQWDRVLIGTLGLNDSYDFVSDEVR